MIFLRVQMFWVIVQQLVHDAHSKVWRTCTIHGAHALSSPSFTLGMCSASVHQVILPDLRVFYLYLHRPASSTIF